MKYLDVCGDTAEEYGVSLLAYAGERITRIGNIFGVDSEKYQDALKRWADIFRLQVKMWPDDKDLAQLDDVPHQHQH